MIKILKVMSLVGLMLAWCLKVEAQTQQPRLVTGSYQNKPLEHVLTDLGTQFNLQVFYIQEWVEGINVSRKFENEPLGNVLQSIFEGLPFSYTFYGEAAIVVLPRDVADNLNGDLPVPSQMPKNLAARIIMLSGQVLDAKTGEAIIGATVALEENKKGTVTDENGRFSLQVSQGVYHLTTKAVGKQTDKRRLLVSGNKRVEISLFESTNQLREVVVTAQGVDHNISSLSMGVSRLNISQIKSLPTFLGEVDVVRSVLSMPGVTTVGDGATGFNVRGGGVDQNLILLDDAPVLNSSHLFGFFSAFNPDMVQDVTLYRGGIPAKYGGRVSSVLDVQLKEGNYKSNIVSGGIGLLSSRLMVEGPLVKDKLAFVLAGRGAYPNWLLKQMPDYTVRQSKAQFYDFNLKADYRLSGKDKLSFSGYHSQDAFRLGADTTYRWNTTNGTLAWHHSFNDKLFSTIKAVAGQYQFEVETHKEPNNFLMGAEMKFKTGKLDFEYQPVALHKVSFGAAATWHALQPGTLSPTSESSSLIYVAMLDEQAMEAAAYVEHEYSVSPNLTLLSGLRYSSFYRLGPGDDLVFQNGREAVDTISYGSGKLMQKYGNWEPRISLRYKFGENNSVKLGYNRTAQYLHLITNTTAVSPVDVWKMSNKHLKPQVGDQVSAGYFHNFAGNTIEVSTELYYKKLYNLVEYRDGARLLLNPKLEADLLPGTGTAYGMEVMLRRKEKKLTGWISYTFSRTLRQVNGPTLEEKINNGEYFPSNYDKPHNFSVVVNQRISRVISISANFNYSTGRPVTYPTSVAIVDGFLMVNYSDRNQYRIPDYHRLDASVTFDGNYKRTTNRQSSWVVSVYNVYGRNNPYSVFMKPSFGGKLPQAYRMAVIGAVIPSVTYNFKFTK